MSKQKNLTQAQREEITRRFRYGDGTLEEENLCIALFVAEAKARLFRAMLDQQESSKRDHDAVAAVNDAHRHLTAVEECRKVTLAACNEAHGRVLAERATLAAMGALEETQEK